MLGALVYLRLTSLKNWFWWRVRRLRQPKYFVGAVVGIAYFYFFFFRHLGASSHPGVRGRGAAAVGPAAADLPDEWLPVALGIGSVVLLLVVAFAWIVPRPRAALGFSEPEIAFLFPAPVTRRALVHFRLVSGQLRSLAAALVMALVSNRVTVFGGNAITHALGWWFIFATLNLHFTAANFTLTRVADRGARVPLVRAGVLIAVVAVLAFAVWRQPALGQPPAGDPQAGLRALGVWLVGVTTTAPLTWILNPLRLVLGPFVATDTHQFFSALAPAFLVVLVHYLWVVRTYVSFEDASITQAERRSQRVAAWRAGDRFRVGGTAPAGRPGPFRLADTGRPEVAFLWKNLLSAWPYFTRRAFVIAALVIITGSLWVNSRPGWHAFGAAAAVIAAIAGAYLLLIGPHFARQDLRSDLRKLDVIRTYPLAGWQIVLGELLAPAAILTGLVWLALLVVLLNSDPVGATEWGTLFVRLAAGIAAATLLPPIVVLQLLVPNAAALVFPSWAEATRTRGGGPEVMGQRMIYLFAQLIAMAVTLAPALGVGFAVFMLVNLFAGVAVALLAATGPVLAVLVAEIAAGLWWLGGRFEKLDLAEELRA